MKKYLFLLLLIPWVAFAAYDTFEGSAVTSDTTIEGSSGIDTVEGGALVAGGPAEIIPDLIDERFETTSGSACQGFDNANFRGNCDGTLDEDYATGSIDGAPASWDSYALQMASGITSDKTYDEDTLNAQAITYVRYEIIVDTESLSDGEFTQFGGAFDNGWSSVFYIYLYQGEGGDSGNRRFTIYNWHDGTGEGFIGDDIISLDTMYRVEVKWDATNDLWEWKVDGVTQDSGSLTSTHPTNIEIIYVGRNESGANVQVYWDNFGVDSNEWIGASQ